MTSRAKKVKVVKSAASAKKKSKLSFFPEALEELKKAYWPTWQEALRLSFLVVIVCGVMGVILGALDYGFTKLLGGLLLSG
ncbi:MAG: preprotein translocase subunit SecE [Dehalococcoidia bacterium]|nr:preprotein translocase subunit SecE [Dehalococcoidia bacterium]